jgi:hypothetical protein
MSLLNFALKQESEQRDLLNLLEQTIIGIYMKCLRFNMAIMVPQPITTASLPAILPKYMALPCPFCDCEKEVRFEMFDIETGGITDHRMTISTYDHTIRKNTAQPELIKYSKIIECYCPQCYVSFSIAKSVGV